MKHTNIGKLLPVDGFIVQPPSLLTVNMSTSLTHFYQPLVGIAAISLYQTLLSEQPVFQGDMEPRTHHVLMNYLHLPLDEVYEARQRLEAIGLMRTFQSQEENGTVYTYVLLRPFTPAEFLDDAMLSLLLHHHLGNDKYERLKKAFYVKPVVNRKAEEVTSTFEDIFTMRDITQHMPPTLGESSMQQTVHTNTTGVNIQTDVIDMNMLKHTLQQRMLPVEVIFTEKNKKVFNQLASLYNLATYEVEKAIQWSLNDANELMINEFKEACHDIYQSKQSSGSIHLTNHRDTWKASKTEEQQTKNVEQSDQKEDMLINHLEQISPRQLLVDLSDGAEPTQKELKMIRDIMTQQGLTPGVMNVLIHYVLLKTDMKLSKPYMETIASHWSRLKVKNVRQAMDVAKKENQKYQQLATKRKNNNNRKQKQDIVPDWFNDHQKEKKQAYAKTNSTKKKTDEEIEREKQALAEALQNMDD
ncbi:replication initiation and membrane attachment family protein [Pontibacillus litoralis]|uniref:Chromosome replication initiation n=1 Tax=Pontibacillus litoralis JSM 072002 TaxID=1385512 RepID=A0A0A5HZQ3_9BACI|nr:DnaD domain protein [Pontibacillus litoralis]KGX89077.1 chromosome replication initiation [Pontibacillus litoralis JSM 072002]